MKNHKNLELLFQYASEYQFEKFNTLFFETEKILSLEEFWEAYLMRAQIKLYASDLMVLEDLEKAERVGKKPQFPFLCMKWRIDAPNRFIIFSKKMDSLRKFLQSLPQIGEKLARWYGEDGNAIVRQMQCEIHYFTGEVNQALAFAESQNQEKYENHTVAILSSCTKFRCYLALRQPQKAEQSMLDGIRLSKTHPECVAAYQAFRAWANVTTSWNGDSPRFYDDPSGKKLPVLEDRLETIRSGSARTTLLEEPFVEYAEHTYENAYALRQYYMDLFHAMYWLSVGDHKQTESYFLGIYDVAVASGVIMPLVECGEQLIPLLKYVKSNNIACSSEWIEDIMSRARQYEENLNLYRSLNV